MHVLWRHVYCWQRIARYTWQSPWSFRCSRLIPAQCLSFAIPYLTFITQKLPDNTSSSSSSSTSSFVYKYKSLCNAKCRSGTRIENETHIFACIHSKAGHNAESKKRGKISAHTDTTWYSQNKMLEFTLLGYSLRRSSFKLRVARGALPPTSWHRQLLSAWCVVWSTCYPPFKRGTTETVT